MLIRNKQKCGLLRKYARVGASYINVIRWLSVYWQIPAVAKQAVDSAGKLIEKWRIQLTDISWLLRNLNPLKSTSMNILPEKPIKPVFQFDITDKSQIKAANKAANKAADKKSPETVANFGLKDGSRVEPYANFQGMCEHLVGLINLY